MTEYISIPNIPPGTTYELTNNQNYVVLKILEIRGTLLIPSNVSATIFIINGIINTGLPNNRAGIWVAPGGKIQNDGKLRLESVVPSNNSIYEPCPAYFADNLGLVISGGTKNFTCNDKQYEFAKAEDVTFLYGSSYITGKFELINLGSLVLNYNFVTFIGIVPEEVENLDIMSIGYKSDDGMEFFGTECFIENVFINTIDSDNTIDLDEESNITINKSLILINRSTSLLPQRNAIECSGNSNLIIKPNSKISINSKFLFTINNSLTITGPDATYYLPKINEPIYQRGQIQTNGVTFSSETT